MASSTSRWCSQAMNQTWMGRTLRIHVNPTPITFTERRSVLQILQQKGDIEVFRQEKHDKARFIAVTKAEQTATDLFNGGVVSYDVSVPKNLPDIAFADLTQPERLDNTKGHVRRSKPSQQQSDDGRVHKNFTIAVHQPPGMYNHTRALYGSPLVGAWPTEYTRDQTLMSGILKESLPANMTAEGFARWDYDLEDRSTVSPKAQRLHEAACLPSRMGGPSESGDASSNQAAEEPLSTHDSS